MRKRLDFDPNKASVSADIFAGVAGERALETTHASVTDAMGNAVAYTTTFRILSKWLENRMWAGFLLNNEMDDFSAKENSPNAFGLLGREANAIEPGKRV